MAGIGELEIGAELMVGKGAVEGEISGRGEVAGDITVLEMPLIVVDLVIAYTNVPVSFAL